MIEEPYPLFQPCHRK